MPHHICDTTCDNRRAHTYGPYDWYDTYDTYDGSSRADAPPPTRTGPAGPTSEGLPWVR